MEFTLKGFTDSIRQNLYDNFPYESDEINDKKHPNRPLHIRDIAFGYLPSIESETSIYFDIGSEYAEEYYPYYHILEDAEVIRKRGRATKSSRGSQANVQPVSKRDYGRISFNGKTYTREYRKNVRGTRSRIGTATKIAVGTDGQVYKINANANYYYNKHYQYIERILNETLPWIAQEYGLQMKRTSITSLEEEYNEQQRLDLITDILSSFEEE